MDLVVIEAAVVMNAFCCRGSPNVTAADWPSTTVVWVSNRVSVRRIVLVAVTVEQAPVQDWVRVGAMIHAVRVGLALTVLLNV